jgi:tripartite-type tricarboxylate transporter receptor subunit TctC
LEIIEKLNWETNAAIADSRIVARLAELGATPRIGSPREYEMFIVEQTEKWSKVIRAANIKAE